MKKQPSKLNLQAPLTPQIEDKQLRRRLEALQQNTGTEDQLFNYVHQANLTASDLKKLALSLIVGFEVVSKAALDLRDELAALKCPNKHTH
jgi:hypothetical protein